MNFEQEKVCKIKREVDDEKMKCRTLNDSMKIVSAFILCQFNTFSFGWICKQWTTTATITTMNTKRNDDDNSCVTLSSNQFKSSFDIIIVFIVIYFIFLLSLHFVDNKITRIFYFPFFVFVQHYLVWERRLWNPVDSNAKHHSDYVVYHYFKLCFITVAAEWLSCDRFLWQA